jgi:hypothetical protein
MAINNRSFSSLRLFQGLAVALVAGAAIVACSSDGPVAPGPIALDALHDELTVARCSWLARCGFTPDQTTCEETQGESRQTLQLLADAVLGRVTYDPAAARACVEATRTQACDNRIATHEAVASACKGMFVGTVADGGPCLFANECTGGVCDTSTCMGESCCLGVCKKAPSPAAIGADCSATACVEGAYCGKPGAMGESPTCKELKDNGQPCESLNACKDGQRCDVSAAAPKCYILSKHGEPCSANLNQGACLQFDDYCDATDRKCKTLPGAGEPCAPGNKCLAYAYCNAGTCKARPGIGEACMEGLACLGTLSCAEMKCDVDDSTEICAF